MARYFRRGTTKIYFATTVAAASAPSVADMAAATELSCEASEINGFQFSNNPIDVPDMCSTFVKNIPGEDTADTSSLTFYEDDTTNPIKTLLAKGTEGFVVFFPYGIGGADPIAGDEAEVWPVSVASNTREWSAANDPARYMVEFTITDVPDQDVLIVA
jgi:hypothetical protein